MTKKLKDKSDPQKSRMERIIVVMPAYNAEKTLEKTYRAIPKGVADEIIVVDDDSHDRTVKVAKKLGLKTFQHISNLGYGGNQKTCYREGLKLKGTVIVMIHPDYQYDASLTQELVRPLVQKRFDIMLGSRIRTRAEALAGGMPLYKYIANRMLSFIENTFLGLNLSEYHTGFRAFRREVLTTLPLDKFSNDFVFDQEILVSAVSLGFKIGETPVPVRYFKEASSINLSRSIIYGLGILLLMAKYFLHKQGVYKFSLFAKNG